MRYWTTHSTSAAFRSPVTHLRFPLSLAGTRALMGITSAWGREPEFLLQLPFDGNDCGRINTQRQLEMQPWRNVLEIFAEALHDGDGVAWHRVIGCPYAQADQHENGKDD
jgi:hypothetical protein